jgi:hypothetical protein
MDKKDTDKKQTDRDDKGFAVHDKRRVGKDEPAGTASGAPEKTDEPAGADRASASKPESPEPGGPNEGAAQAQSPPPDPEPTPSGDGTKREDRPGTGPESGEHGYMPLTFTSFIMSLSTSALVFLGQVPDPASGKTITDLTGARQMIDLISLLKDKTAGNLTPDEAAFVDTILYDLRMLFVKANA